MFGKVSSEPIIDVYRRPGGARERKVAGRHSKRPAKGVFIRQIILLELTEHLGLKEILLCTAYSRRVAEPPFPLPKAFKAFQTRASSVKSKEKPGRGFLSSSATYYFPRTTKENYWVRPEPLSPCQSGDPERGSSSAIVSNPYAQEDVKKPHDSDHENECGAHEMRVRLKRMPQTSM